jgi:hypothetical protein
MDSGRKPYAFVSGRKPYAPRARQAPLARWLKNAAFAPSGSDKACRLSINEE